MKKSTYTKSLQYKGTVRMVTGEIKVTMDWNIQEYECNNPSTHDTEKKTRRVHKIEAFIDNKKWWEDSSIVSENLVLSEVKRCGKEMMEEMKKLANNHPAKTFAKKMNDLDFK